MAVTRKSWFWDLSKRKSGWRAFFSYLFVSFVVGVIEYLVWGALPEASLIQRYNLVSTAAAVGLWAWLGTQRQLSNKAGIICFLMASFGGVFLGTAISLLPLLYILRQPVIGEAPEDELESIQKGKAGNPSLAYFNTGGPESSDGKSLDSEFFN